MTRPVQTTGNEPALTRRAYCARCTREVTLAVPAVPLHQGQATLPDSGDVVCLDFGQQCSGAMCGTLGVPRIVMGVRLARSGLRPHGLATVRAVCDGCWRLVDMAVVDETHAHCPDCSTVNTWTLVRVDGEEWVAVTGARAELELR